GVAVGYGDNGAGKSGYVRVLKKLCRARGGAHSIHPNIFQQAAGTPSATIDFAVGNEERTHLWIDGQPGPAELASVTIFDSETAAVYVENENDVAYRPFGLDLLSKLASACGAVRAALSSELSSLRQNERAHPELLGETAVGDLLRALEAEGSESELERLATVTEKDQPRLGQLKLLVAQFDA